MGSGTGGAVGVRLRDLQREAYTTAVKRGQWERDKYGPLVGSTPYKVSQVIRNEVHELDLELVGLDAGKQGAKGDAAFELADVVIACASSAEALDIDLEAAVREKMDENAQRAGREEDTMTDAEKRELEHRAEAEAGETPEQTWRRRYEDVTSVIDSITQAAQYGDLEAIWHWCKRLDVYTERVAETSARGGGEEWRR